MAGRGPAGGATGEKGHVSGTLSPGAVPARPARPLLPSLASDEVGVTPVLGTILVLGITVVGIAGIMLWGAPTIARIQAQNAQLGMVGEFEDLRMSTQELSVPDHSRFPTVVLPGGTLAMEEGTRFLITANLASGCTLAITEWSDSDDDVDVDTTGCGSATTVEVHEVSGSNTIERTAIPLTGGDKADGGSDAFSSGDWLFLLTNGGSTIYSEAWLLTTDLVSWRLNDANTRNVYLDGGAIFSATDGTTFLNEDPALGDTGFGPGYVGLWLRTLDADSYDSLTGQGSHQVYLSLTGNQLRIDQSTVYSVRYDFHGSLAEAWCNALVGRNPSLSAASYTEVASSTCDTGDSEGVRAVAYALDSGTFEYRLLEAQIHASLVA